ncbi:MAG: hypothetical protein VX887_01890, partial [Candidatus Neomarinimicrobiota bacterium]|nr:hypothetical protein [Candidatus Neomarinimicrobiota bacterium]
MIIPATMPKTGINILSICNSYINLLYKCKVYLCRRCFKNKPVGTTTFVASAESLAAGGVGNDEDCEDGEDGEDCENGGEDGEDGEDGENGGEDGEDDDSDSDFGDEG